MSFVYTLPARTRYGLGGNVVSGSGACIDAVLSGQISGGNTQTVMTPCPPGTPAGTVIHPNPNPNAPQYNPRTNDPCSDPTSVAYNSEGCIGAPVPQGANAAGAVTQGATATHPTVPSPCPAGINLVSSNTQPAGSVYAGTDSNGNTQWAVPVDPTNCTQQALQGFFTNLANIPANQPTACGGFWAQCCNPSCTWGQDADCTDFLNQLFNTGCSGTTAWLMVGGIVLGVGLLVVYAASR
jgi:hypothetical protein